MVKIIGFKKENPFIILFECVNHLRPTYYAHFFTQILVNHLKVIFVDGYLKNLL